MKSSLQCHAVVQSTAFSMFSYQLQLKVMAWSSLDTGYGNGSLSTDGCAGCQWREVLLNLKIAFFYNWPLLTFLPELCPLQIKSMIIICT